MNSTIKIIICFFLKSSLKKEIKIIISHYFFRNIDNQLKLQQ